jgi:hypothetical protein
MAIGGGARCTGGPCHGRQQWQWQRHWTMVDDDDDDDSHGGGGRPWRCPPSPPAVPAHRRVASLSLPALLVAFGLPLLASSRSNTAKTADAQSSSDCPPHGGCIQRHCRDSNDRDDVDVGVNCREVGRRGADQHHHHRQGNDETMPTMLTMAHRRPGFPPPFGRRRRAHDNQCK